MKRGFLYGTKLHIDCAVPVDVRVRGAFFGNAESEEPMDLF
jgi:hypothetical protein